jgi:hypothetical protein
MCASLVFVLLALRLEDATQVIVCMLLAQFFLWFYNGPINAMIANATGAEFRARAFALSILSIHLFGDSISPTLVGRLSDTLEAAGNPASLSLALGLVPAAMVVCILFWAWGWRTLPEAA